MSQGWNHLMYGALICYWAFGWLWLGHTVRVEFEGKSLVKPLCKMVGEGIDINTLQSVWLIQEG